MHICTPGHWSSHIRCCITKPFRHDGFQFLEHMFPENAVMHTDMPPCQALATMCLGDYEGGSRARCSGAVKGV